MLARDIMTRDPVVATSSTSVAEIIDTFADERFRHLPIVDGHELVGVVSDRDVRSYAIGAAATAARMRAPVSTIMTGAPIAVGPDDDVDDVIDVLVENKVGAVPVVDPDGAVVGIISMIDVIVAARGRL